VHKRSQKEASVSHSSIISVKQQHINKSSFSSSKKRKCFGSLSGDTSCGGPYTCRYIGCGMIVHTPRTDTCASMSARFMGDCLALRALQYTSAAHQVVPESSD